MKTNNKWASKMGFILATAGAAIGLGNLWKFPYHMGVTADFRFWSPICFLSAFWAFPL